MAQPQVRAEGSSPLQKGEAQPEEQLAASRKFTLAEKIARAMEADTESHVYDMPTAPMAVPGSRARTRRAKLGAVVNKIPYV